MGSQGSHLWFTHLEARWVGAPVQQHTELRARVGVVCPSRDLVTLPALTPHTLLPVKKLSPTNFTILFPPCGF